MLTFAEIVAVLVPIVHALGVVHALHAVMHARTSQGAIAWSVSLVSVPFIAIPLYWVFGRSRFDEYVEMLREVMKRNRHALERIEAGFEKFKVELQPDVPVSQRLLENLSLLPFSCGNSVELLEDGAATFGSILEALEKAERYVLLQFYIVRDDLIGRDVQKALIECAKRGVKVLCVFDSIGSFALPSSFVSTLTENGVKVEFFRAGKKRWLSRLQLNFRNHRKVVVIDGQIAFIGGLNIGDEYMGRSKEFGHWRDTHLKIMGPAVLPIQIAFSADWYWATGEHLGGIVTEPAADRADKSVVIVPTGPADSQESASLLFNHLIQSAKRRVWIASPYLVPDNAVMSALRLARLRGVEIRLLIPDEADHFLAYLAAFAYCSDTTCCGIEVYRYTNGFMHQKVVLIDDCVSMIGTANLDNRSFRLNFEMSAVIVDTGFAKQVEQMLIRDMAGLEPVPEDERHSWLFRAAIQCAKLLSPVL